MTIVPILWSVWVICVLSYAVLHLYRSRLARDEEDQIFLDDSFSHERTAQAAIVARVAKVEPMVKVSLWLTAAATLAVIAYYIFDIIHQFK